jgi:hypothetical protein
LKRAVDCDPLRELIFLRDFERGQGTVSISSDRQDGTPVSGYAMQLFAARTMDRSS